MSILILAVTTGGVAGIGPEITAQALLGHDEMHAECVPVVIGDEAAKQSVVQSVGGDPEKVRVIGASSEATNEPGTIELLQTGPSLADVELG